MDDNISIDVIYIEGKSIDVFLLFKTVKEIYF